jgi:hypothetical protein
MEKYKKAAINLAFLTMILSTGITGSYLALNPDLNLDSDFSLTNKENTKYSQAKQEKILSTFEDGDYQSWKKIIGQNNKLNNIIDEFSFQRFVTARIAARGGQYDKALKITAELKKELANKLS